MRFFFITVHLLSMLSSMICEKHDRLVSLLHRRFFFNGIIGLQWKYVLSKQGQEEHSGGRIGLTISYLCPEREPEFGQRHRAPCLAAPGHK